jgi:hypothetical protein
MFRDRDALDLVAKMVTVDDKELIAAMAKLVHRFF